MSGGFSLIQPGTASFLIDVQRVFGFDGAVTAWNVLNLPEGFTWNITPTGNPDEHSLEIEVPDVADDVVPFIVEATSGSLVRRAAGSLNLERDETESQGGGGGDSCPTFSLVISPSEHHGLGVRYWDVFVIPLSAAPVSIDSWLFKPLDGQIWSPLSGTFMEEGKLCGTPDIVRSDYPLYSLDGYQDAEMWILAVGLGEGCIVQPKSDFWLYGTAGAETQRVGGSVELDQGSSSNLQPPCGFIQPPSSGYAKYLLGASPPGFGYVNNGAWPNGAVRVGSASGSFEFGDVVVSASISPSLLIWHDHDTLNDSADPTMELRLSVMNPSGSGVASATVRLRQMGSLAGPQTDHIVLNVLEGASDSATINPALITPPLSHNAGTPYPIMWEVLVNNQTVGTLQTFTSFGRPSFKHSTVLGPFKQYHPVSGLYMGFTFTIKNVDIANCVGIDRTTVGVSEYTPATLVTDGHGNTISLPEAGDQHWISVSHITNPDTTVDMVVSASWAPGTGPMERPREFWVFGQCSSDSRAMLLYCPVKATL